jgi:hypothetical protein
MSVNELDSFKRGDLVTCGTDRHPLVWKIIHVHMPCDYHGHLVHLVDLMCVDTLRSTHRGHRVGMCRTDTSTAQLTHYREKTGDKQ